MALENNRAVRLALTEDMNETGLFASLLLSALEQPRLACSHVLGAFGDIFLDQALVSSILLGLTPEDTRRLSFARTWTSFHFTTLLPDERDRLYF